MEIRDCQLSAAGDPVRSPCAAAEDNLILHNRNRGIYLGNQTAHGTIRNNLILNNVTGIGVFADTDVTIENNVITGSEYAGIGARDRSRIRVRNNVISSNQRGMIVFEELGAPRMTVGANTLWGNRAAAEDFELPSETIEAEPQFVDAGAGDFSRAMAGTESAPHGLSDPAVISALWPRWQAVSSLVLGESGD